MSALTVVICAYTEARWDTLHCSIDETLKQLRFGDELILVVDHNDALLARCHATFSACVVIANYRPRGLSGARNSALDQARGTLIAFVDDDAVPLDGWLDALREPYADQRVYGVGGLARPLWLGGRPRWFPDEFLWVVGCSHRGLPSKTEPVRNLIGANMSFRKAAFDRIGGFTETMGRIGERPVGCEETEFSIRVSQANAAAVLLYEPQAEVEHHIAPQRGSVGYFVRRCWAEGESKAEVTRRVGSGSALSSERHYTSRVLPKAVWNGLRDSAAGDLWGAARSLAIALGLASTVGGYCAASALNRLRQRDLPVSRAATGIGEPTSPVAKPDGKRKPR
jgi:glycosyltransferase involved in cell wall biosynthesis